MKTNLSQDGLRCLLADVKDSAALALASRIVTCETGDDERAALILLVSASIAGNHQAFEADAHLRKVKENIDLLLAADRQSFFVADDEKAVVVAEDKTSAGAPPELLEIAKAAAHNYDAIADTLGGRFPNVTRACRESAIATRAAIAKAEESQGASDRDAAMWRHHGAKLMGAVDVLHRIIFEDLTHQAQNARRDELDRTHSIARNARASSERGD